MSHSATGCATHAQLPPATTSEKHPQNTPSCAVAVPRGRNCATQGHYSATTTATIAQPTRLKALADKVLQRNRQRNQCATTPEKQRNSEAQNQPQKLRSFEPEKTPLPAQPAAQPVRNSEEISSPAREFLELAVREFVTLHTDGRGGLWWTSPRYADDPGSLSYISEVWGEAWPDLFRLLESGGLDHFLPKRATTPPLSLDRPRRKRITKEMLERYRKARPWIEAHMPALLAQGWTRRTLFRAGRHPHPCGQWGLAWSSGWTSLHLARVEIGEDGVAFVLAEPHRTVTQTARPV